MNFKIIEQKVIGKDNTILNCEDRIVVTENFACVIDGATSKSDILFEGKTQGKIAGELIEIVINKLPKDATINLFISLVNKKFKKFYAEKNLEIHMKENPIDRLNASLVMYNFHQKEIWLIGDCQALVGRKRIRNPKLIDEVLSNLRALIIELELIKGKTIEDIYEEDSGRNYIMKFLKEQYKFQNDIFQSDFSYGVLDGFEINKKYVKRYNVTHAKNIILASDGYPKIYSSLSKTEKYLLKILKKDPLCFRENKSTKGLQKGQISYDDRAYLKIEIE